MFHKRKVDLSTLREPDQKRFRHNVSNLFLTKTVSARRANELMKDAQIAGAAGVKDLVKGAEKSGSGEKQANWEKQWISWLQVIIASVFLVSAHSVLTCII